MRSLIPFLIGLALPLAAHAGIDARTLGLKADGVTDDTLALQAALDAGQTDLEFPGAKYLLGGVTLPARTHLRFAPQARIVVNPEQIFFRVEVMHGKQKRMETREKPLFEVKGDGVTLEGLRFDFTSGGSATDPTPVDDLIRAEGVSDLTVRDFHVENSLPRELVPLEKRSRWASAWQPPENAPKEARRDSKVLLHVENCRHIVLENSVATRITHMLEATGCAQVASRGNVMTTGLTMTTFVRGSESLEHSGNWSRDVNYQCVWRGGSPDPSRKAETVPLGSSTVVQRGVQPGDPAYHGHMAGAYDIRVHGNYADYGTTLCWGNKGRQVVIDSNIARFMGDYAYGTEGGENVVFSNNISINSTSGGIVSMYWGDKLLLQGNLLLTRHEPCDLNWSRFPRPSAYLGPLVRLHHGPSNPEDHYGAGTTTISHNLFNCELTQVARGVTVQGGRDVLFAGNKFLNAGLTKVGAGKITVTGNEFISRLAMESTMVRTGHLATMALIRGNVFRREPPPAPGTEAQKIAEKEALPYLLFTPKPEGAEKAEAEPEEEEKPARAAIVLTADRPFFGVVQDNIIEGWKEASLLTNYRRNQASYVVTGNITDGLFNEVENGPGLTKIQQDNLQLP